MVLFGDGNPAGNKRRAGIVELTAGRAKRQVPHRQHVAAGAGLRRRADDRKQRDARCSDADDGRKAAPDILIPPLEAEHFAVPRRGFLYITDRKGDVINAFKEKSGAFDCSHTNVSVAEAPLARRTPYDERCLPRSLGSSASGLGPDRHALARPYIFRA